MPVIASFAASPSTISSSQSVSLNWSVSGADSLSITPSPGAVTGSTVSTTVAATTTYTLTAKNSAGSSTKSTTVTLAQAQGPVRIIFLHHSTGEAVWDGGVASYFATYNAANGTSYQITQQNYPDAPYEWNNYPYDYWNLWVNPSNGYTDLSTPTVPSLSTLCGNYDVIVFKHCYPASDILPDIASPTVSSDVKCLANYKLQYAALKSVLNEHSNKKFILWTGAAEIAANSTADRGARSRSFFEWVKGTWDVKGDNIFVWDFFELETEGGNFLLPAYSAGTGNSHPGSAFCTTVAPLLGKRIVDVIEGRGDTGTLTGK